MNIQSSNDYYWTPPNQSPRSADSVFKVPPGGNQEELQDTLNDISQQPTTTTETKQGAYGLVPIHKEPLWRQLLWHWDEMYYVILFLAWKQIKSNSMIRSQQQKQQDRYHKYADDLLFCNDMLGKVSRSFSTVIRQLPPTLRVDVLVFYLILRALDTIEDDVETFSKSPTTKREQVNLLKKFHQMALPSSANANTYRNAILNANNNSGNTTTPPIINQWSLHHVGQGDEQRLLQEFPRVQRVYNALSEESKTIIADITKRMGAGMAETVGNDLTRGTKDLDEYNQYCIYVAGLVGQGLSRLFAQSGVEASYLAEEIYLSNQMGLFLQKTNIIRDYLEDYVEGRTFWPQSIWKKYDDGNDDLGYFSTFLNETDSEKASMIKENALKCLNEMITDALELVPSCLAYLSELQCLEVFRFCAIPQVMAMATLANCYANSKVFTGVVKIRKGLSCKLIMKSSNNMDGVHRVFYEMAKSMEKKAHKLRRSGFMDPSYDALLDACDVIYTITEPAYRRHRRAKLVPVVFVAAVLACHIVPYLMQAMVAVAVLNYCFGPFKVFENKDPSTILSSPFLHGLWNVVLGNKN